MKIWIDLTNSPHINFFKPFISQWRLQNHEVIITSRNLSNTIDLIKQNNWNYEEIGGHAGKAIIKKLMYFPKRVFLLWKYLKASRPDIGISHSSFYSPIVCKMLGIPSVYLNDNEHAKGNYLAFRYATVNILPEFLETKAKKMKWDVKYNMAFYPGIKEGIYLSQSNISKKDRNISQKKGAIYIRLEPWTAQYYSGKNHFIDELILKLKENHNIIILPRSIEKAKHYKSQKFHGITVAEKPIPLELIYENCAVFIGAGGSMTRELAYLGVPTLSVYQDELLEVDKYLINKKIMFFSLDPKSEYIEQIMSLHTNSMNTELAFKGNEAFHLIDEKVNEYAKN